MSASARGSSRPGGLARGLASSLVVPAAVAAFTAAGWVWENLAAPDLADPWAPQRWPALALYLAAYAVGGWEPGRSGLRSLRAGRIDIDLLMVAAALGAFAIGQAPDGAVLIFIFALSHSLEEYALDRTRSAIHSLVSLRPTQARRLLTPPQGAAGPEEVGGGGQVAWVPVEELRVGDLVEVLPGERLPVDGVIVQGRSAVDLSAMTGESIPQGRGPGDEVLAGSVNLQGLLWVRVTKKPEESTLARIIQLVEQARERKARLQRFIERFEGRYSAAVVAGTLLLVLAGPLALGWEWRETLRRAMTAMVAASPCAVVLSTMPTMLSAMAASARRGVLFKGAVHLEQLGAVRVVAFDKTGTLTAGTLQVTEVVAGPGWEETAVVALAAGAEGGSEHPVARAIVREANRLGLRPQTPQWSRVRPGRGVEAQVGVDRVVVGSPAWFREMGLTVSPALAASLQRLEAAGQTAMLVGIEGAGAVGVIAVTDRVREEAASAVAALRRLGVRRVVMLTGDNPRVAEAIGAQVGVDEVHAALLPEQKMEVLERLKTRFGTVAMVGDGINDAPALAAASVGIAMGGAGTDVALETADVVLMSDDLARLEGAIALGRAAERTVRHNLAFAFTVMAGLLALAAMGHLSLTQAVVGHEGSTVLVALNGLRLLAYRWPKALQVRPEGARPALAQPDGLAYTRRQRADVAQW